jgi:hypothetical protein
VSAQKKEQISRIDAMYMGFGGQSRGCPGQNLGKMFVIKGVKRVFEEFGLQVSGDLEKGCTGGLRWG